MISPDDVKRLLPKVVAWVSEMEKAVLKLGYPLLPLNEQDARRIGVDRVGEVRIAVLSRIPRPPDQELATLATRTGLITENTEGMAFAHGIVLKGRYQADRALVAHELAHVKQYERLGGIEPFLRSYFREVLFPPYYPLGPMELEAQREARRVCDSAA